MYIYIYNDGVHGGICLVDSGIPNFFHTGRMSHGIFSSLIVDSSFTGSLWDMTMPGVCHFFSVRSAHLMVQTDIKLYRYNWLKKHYLSNPQQNLCLVLFHHSFKPPAGTQWPLFEGASQKLLSLINLYARSVEPEKGEWLRRFKI